MKKILLFFSLIVFAFNQTRCEEKICHTTDYTIINRIESDIVVKLKHGDKKEITINPGDSQVIYHSYWCRDVNAAPSMTPEVLIAEMIIDGEIVSNEIWMRGYWDVDTGVVGDNYSSYTLTVTDELLETIKSLQY